MLITKGRASYAANMLAAVYNTLNQNRNTIYLLDFDDHTATDPTTDDWFDWEDDFGELSFARHHGRINCLYEGGGVFMKDPDEIRPDTQEVIEDYWGQEND